MIRALASCGRQDRRFFLRALLRGRRPASLMPDLLWLADFVGLAGSAPAFRKSIATASLLECFRAHKCTRGCIARNTHCRALRSECRKWGESGHSLRAERRSFIMGLAYGSVPRPR